MGINNVGFLALGISHTAFSVMDVNALDWPDVVALNNLDWLAANDLGVVNIGGDSLGIPAATRLAEVGFIF